MFPTSSQTSNLECFISECTEIVGESHIVQAPSSIDPAHWTTSGDQRTVLAHVRPGTVTETREIVNMANRYHIPLYPVSKGNNWGYGSKLPVLNGNVVVDLSRMNRILEIDAELAYAVVEPGVSYQQLSEHIRSNNLELRVDPTGAGPNASVLGNSLERGVGIGRYADHFSSLCGMEIVLATGEILRTGFWRHDNSTSKHSYRYGCGPYLDGLFSQSSFGIVTKIGLWLEPVPEAFETCLIRCSRNEQIEGVITGLRKLLLSGTLRAPVVLAHQNRVLTTRTQYPWQLMRDSTPMSPDVSSQLAADHGVSAWTGLSGLSGSRAEIRVARQRIKELVGVHAETSFVSENKLEWLERYARFSKRIGFSRPSVQIGRLRSIFEVLRGQPGNLTLRTAYWRNREHTIPESDLNPARDRCGLKWLSPVLSLYSDAPLRLEEIARPICESFGFDYCPAFLTLGERALICTLPILFDRDEATEVAKADRCISELSNACASHGIYSYRLGISSMARECAHDHQFWHTVSLIKSALDPQQILAPGRYNQQRLNL